MRKDIRLAFTIPFNDVKKSIQNGKNSLTALVLAMNHSECTEDEESFKCDVIRYVKEVDNLLMLLKDPEKCV
jgi:hypothetical protein